MSAERFRILLTKCCGKKKEKKLLKSSTTKVDVLPGTLLLLLEVVKNSSSNTIGVLETIDQDSDIEVQCSLSDIKEISREQFDLLINVPTCADRFTIFQNKEWLAEGIELKEGDYVNVYDKQSARDLVGLLRYKGEVSGIDGIHFGVQYEFNEGHGHSDGSFRNKQYFKCPPESAVFVGLHKIRKHKGPLPAKQFEGATAGNHYGYPGVRGAAYNNGLMIGDRVVWMSDNGPEPGRVKWIGLLPDCRRDDDITVGVEFDHPVGSGTGKYRDQRLFNARQNHASLVPIMGLLKEEEIFPRQPKQLTDNDNALAALVEAEGSGKTQAQVIEEQRRIMEEALQNVPTRSPGDGSKQDYYLDKKKNSEHIEHAMVHLPPPSNNLPAPVPCKGPMIQSRGESKGVNPLYEYSRSKQDYLAEGLGEVLIADGNEGKNLFRQKPHPEPDPDLMIGSLVEVMSSKPLYGVIKWIGNVPDQPKILAGLEMEEETPAGSDGTFKNHRMFHCPPRKGLFVPLYKCRKDKRFVDDGRISSSSDRSIYFGSTETPDLPGTVSPPTSLESIKSICGKSRGIQGHHNSCYMDATLLAMFYFTTVFDSILHRPKSSMDIPEYTSVQQVLKEGIVNPLRRHYYVRADKIMTLRKLLHEVGKIPGMMSEEKDPEEFLNLLLNEVTKADPFLRICSEDSKDTQQTYFYQLIMEKDERLVLPTTQQLFELSFLQLGIKLKEVPSCLIIQMPRFGKDYKMYKRIVPSIELDITDVLENAPRECIICGDLAIFECKECYQIHGAGLNTIAFCEGCKKTSHQHKQRVNHKCRQITVPQAYRDIYTRQKAKTDLPVPIPREKMQLFAVICIQTSHYVSFVRNGKGRDAKWIFFDSMADRMGEQSGYNIPEVRECSEIPYWLSDEHHNDIMKYQDDKALPEHMRRLICDAYICMYQSPDVMMFK